MSNNVINEITEMILEYQTYRDDIKTVVNNAAPDTISANTPFSQYSTLIQGCLGGAQLNVGYGDTPPDDNTKLWCKTSEPTTTEIQNYLGNISVGTSSYFDALGEGVNPYLDNFTWKYVGNNECAILYKNMFYIYNLTSKTYTYTKTINSNTSSKAISIVYDSTNDIYYLLCSSSPRTVYKLDRNADTVEVLFNLSSSYGNTYFMCMRDNDNLAIFIYYSGSLYINVYTISTGTQNYTYSFSNSSKYYADNSNYYCQIGTDVYLIANINTYYHRLYKYDLVAKTVNEVTAYYTFLTNNSLNGLYNSCPVYDGERYMYFLGGYINTNYNVITRWDMVNNTFEILDTTLIRNESGVFGTYGDGRLYYCGYSSASPTPATSQEKLVYYFDITHSLTENKLSISTNCQSDGDKVALINEDSMKLLSVVSGSYKGNSSNLAEKVNTYVYKNNAWRGINCDDPIKINAISNQALISGNSTTIPLVVTTISGVTYSLSASSVETGIATASVSGNTLTINAFNGGTTAITVNAISSVYGICSTTFVIVVTPVVATTVTVSHTMFDNANLNTLYEPFEENSELAMKGTILKNANGSCIIMASGGININNKKYLVFMIMSGDNEYTNVVSEHIGFVFEETTQLWVYNQATSDGTWTDLTTDFTITPTYGNVTLLFGNIVVDGGIIPSEPEYLEDYLTYS